MGRISVKSDWAFQKEAVTGVRSEDMSASGIFNPLIFKNYQLRYI